MLNFDRRTPQLLSEEILKTARGFAGRCLPVTGWRTDVPDQSICHRDRTEHFRRRPANAKRRGINCWYVCQPCAKHGPRSAVFCSVSPIYSLAMFYHQPAGGDSGAGRLSGSAVCFGGIARLVAGYVHRGLPGNWLQFVIGILDLVIAGR